MLRGYQEEMIDRVEAAWAAAQPNVIGVLPTGSGKTTVMSHIARRHQNEAGIAIAHRSVLVGQISMALARAGLPHDIIASKSVVRTIVGEHMEELGRNYYAPGARWKVASVDTLPGRAASLSSWVRQVTIGFTDECFPAGTLVDGKPIESIKVGDTVTAFNEHTGGFESRLVARLFKNPIPGKMVLLRVAHHGVRCTSWHPFWTRRGWVSAIDLTTDDEVLDYGVHLHELRQSVRDDGRAPTVSDAKDGQSVLPEILRVGAPNEHWEKEAPATPGDTEMCELREAVCGHRFQADVQDTIVQQGMRGVPQEPHVVGDGIENEPQVRITADGVEQPYVQPREQGEDGRNPSEHRTRPNCEGRERSRVDRVRSATVREGGTDGIRGAACGSDKEASGLPVPLQDRPCPSETESGRGGGRLQPLGESQERAGREERRVPTWRRVDSVSVYEPTSVDGDFVYNIEVEGLHTYVAEGIVVHNCHHVLAENKWGRECLRFDNPAIRWFLPTATPERGDRKGLGRQADGIADVIVEGPSMRWHIDNGYLTDYLIRAPMPADLDLSDVQVSASGEYNQKQLRRAVHRSAKIIGNVVDTYRQFTPGKLGIVFAVDIEHAKALTAEFVAKGVTAELITAEHSEEERRVILRRYRNRETLVLVNVDLFGEGFDLPAIEVVMFARPTASYALYAQQFGRGLRLMIDKAFMAMWEQYTPEQRKAIIAQSGKPVAHIHDHVGNVLHFFGPPDKPRQWTLERLSARRSGPSDAIPLRVCVNELCMQPYERFYPRCPYCGMEPPVPAGVALPEEVDGDLTLYTPEMLRALFGVESAADALAKQPSSFCAIPPGVGPAVVHALQKRHNQKLQQQAKLRELMPLVMPPTLGDREAMRRFYLRYGVDVVQAKLLGAAETEDLNKRLLDSIAAAG